MNFSHHLHSGPVNRLANLQEALAQVALHSDTKLYIITRPLISVSSGYTDSQRKRESPRPYTTFKSKDDPWS